MEYYQAQYYNEALMHYGVKGMKWGVRRKRAANYLKESGKLIYNKVRHPIRSDIAMDEINRGARLKTIARRSLVSKLRIPLYSGKELANMNKNIKQQNIDMRNKRIARKKGLEPKQKRRRVRPVTYAGERVKLTANRVIHPIRTGVASATGRKNNRMKTLLRKKVALSSYDMENINKDVKKQNIAMKKQRNARKRQRRQRIANKRLRKIRAKEARKKKK